MAKTFLLTFGTGQPVTGLAPTFISWQFANGTTGTPPGITSPISATGFYQFVVSGPSQAIFFTVDGATTGLSNDDRYIKGSIDPVMFADESIGTIADSFGSTSVDPTTLFGYLKRNLEIQEGDANYNKTSGVWSLYDRTGVTLLQTKVLTNTSSLATKS